MNLDTQVLIVGAGPVGMLAALMLAQAGIRVVIVERRLERLSAPKAHAVNPRTLEICERLGVPAETIRRAGASREEGGEVHFVSTLTGARFGSLPYERQDDAVRAFTPFPLTNIAQPQFEAELGQALDTCDGVTLLRGVTCAGLVETPDGVTAAIEGRGWQAAGSIEARYVIAADGAGSRVRQMLGIGMEGREALQHYMMIHFEADLSALTADRPGMLYFCTDPARSGTFIAYDRARTWVFMQAYDPEVQSEADFPVDVCAALVEAAIGKPVPDLRIRNLSPWTMSAQVASAYRAGRVFLVGDAAHRFPPTGGLGLNTGAGDAQNLCWKLAKVLDGTAAPALLDAYESERRPVALINSRQSVINSAKLRHLFAALYGPERNKRDAYFESVCAEPGAHPAIAEAVELQRPHFDSLNLQLGYRYGADVDPENVPVSRYTPSWQVGDCLPHTLLADGGWLLGRLPTTAFSLLVGPAGERWMGMDMTTLREGADFAGADGPWHEAAGLAADGALLIRPDGHIAGRWETAPSDAAEAVATRLMETLGRPHGSRD